MSISLSRMFVLRYSRSVRLFASQVSDGTQAKTFRDYRWEDARDRGSFADLQEYTEKKGVVTAAMPSLLPPNHGIMLPNIPVRDISDSFGKQADLSETALNKVCLIGLSFRESGRAALQTWLKPFALQNQDDRHQYVELAIVESTLHRLLVRNLFRKSVHSVLKAARHPGLPTKHLFCFDDIIQQLNQLEIRNRLAGYIFLVDGKGRIRWRASGEFHSDKYPNFESYVATLHDELRRSDITQRALDS